MLVLVDNGKNFSTIGGENLYRSRSAAQSCRPSTFGGAARSVSDEKDLGMTKINSSLDMSTNVFGMRSQRAGENAHRFM